MTKNRVASLVVSAFAVLMLVVIVHTLQRDNWSAEDVDGMSTILESILVAVFIVWSQSLWRKS